MPHVCVCPESEGIRYLYLGLQAVVSHWILVLQIEPRSLGRATNVLNHSGISLALTCFVLCCLAPMSESPMLSNRKN